jgi:hypothetical protein
MIKIANRHLSDNEINNCIKLINKKGYSKIKNFFSKKTVDYLLLLIKKNYEAQKKYAHLIKTPNVWNQAKIIYNLQNKDLSYIKLAKNKYLEKILIKKINDPTFRNAKKEEPNYILNHLIARSSGKESLFLHIDSGVPTGSVTIFMQIMIVLENTVRKNGCTVVVPGSHLSQEFADRKIRKFDYLEGEPGDIFIWDGNLWHGSLPNLEHEKNTRWNIIATYCNWQFKQVFDIPRGLPNSIYRQLNKDEKRFLGFCSIPSLNEKERVSRSIPVEKLLKKQKDYYRFSKD